MLKNPKTIYPSVGFGLLAGLGYALRSIIGDSVVFGSMVFVGASVFAGAGLVTFLEYIASWVAELRLTWKRGDTITWEGELAERIKGLDSEGLQLLRELIQSDELGDTGPGAYYGGVFIPDSFIREVIAGSRGDAFCQERVYSEGSNKRHWYKALASYLIREGVAEPARGPYPLRVSGTWRDVTDAINRAPEKLENQDGGGSAEYGFKPL